MKRLKLFPALCAVAALTLIVSCNLGGNSDDDDTEDTKTEETKTEETTTTESAIGYTAVTGDGSSMTYQSLPLTTIAIDSSAGARAVLNASGDVDTTALQAALDTFDNEDELAPYIIASSDTGGGSWTLTYGSAAGSSLCGTTVYKDKESIANGFDAINYAMKALPSSRSTKLKIRVDSDLYSGEPSSSDGTSAISSVSNLYSIEVYSKCILDFNGHTLYANNTTASEIVPISMKKKSNISIRNLCINGHARYAIWCLGCDNVVFDNIVLTMDSSSGLGLRIAESGNTWSKNVYVDNITVTGCQDNAVETMKVDGVYIGTVTATDCNDCGLLLNTTTNAVVGVVNGTRCSPRSSNGVYAALRTANYVGPDVYIHQINAVECGRGYFSVSANCGITIDEINSTNSYAQAILVQDTQNLHIKSGTLTAGSNNKSKGIELTNGSAGGSLSVMNNTFENITITGYTYPIYERDVADYNDFINCTTTGGQFSSNSVKSARTSHSDSTLTIADGTTEIADGAYMYYTNITSVTIPASVTSIGKNAFYGCTSLQSVTFESGSALTTIGDAAFGNTAITSITFPSSVTSFGSNIMSTACSSVTVQSTAIETMGTEAFFNLADPSTITFTTKSVYSDNTYSSGSYGNWYYWYGYTRSTLK